MVAQRQTHQEQLTLAIYKWRVSWQSATWEGVNFGYLDKVWINLFEH